jgi:D-alanine-D-alanine ligase
MRIGIAYDLNTGPPDGGEPEDLYEEFDSPVTIEAIAGVLRDLGHEIDKLGDGTELVQQLLSRPPNLVFNLAEGQGVGRAREARVPGLLEMLGIPYTGSDPLTLGVTLDKDWAKRIVAADSIPAPKGTVVYPDQDLAGVTRSLEPLCPLIAKPAWEGSSKGIGSRCLIENPNEIRGTVVSLCRTYKQPVLVEEYITGDELTIGISGNRSPQLIGIMKIVPKEPTDRFVYGLQTKRDYERLVHYECPAQLIPEVHQRVSEVALRTYRSLGCRDIARLDFRLRDGVPYFLEANPLPGLNPESSDLVILAELAGWTYSQLIGAILNAALERTQGSGASATQV